DGVPVLHRGPVAEVERYYAARASGPYLRGMRETRALLAELGHPDPLSYELHVPMVVTTAGMSKALTLGRHLDVLHKRTMFGVLEGLGGGRVLDVRVRHRGPPSPKASTFLTTMPDSFADGAVVRHIRAAFPQACRYERRR